VPSHTIFFTGCTFSCVYCQNWEISTAPQSGISILPQELAGIITLRRKYGSRNVNFVTPTPHTHIILKILNALKVNIPVVWNSNMYYSEEVARLLEGVVDVYLGDFRYGNDKCARKYSNAPDYLSVVTRNFRLAYTVGEILLRQLVLPGHLECCTKPIVEWTKENIPKVRFNLMFQYRPEYRTYEYSEINRLLTAEEMQRALEIVKEAELEDVLV
jgi:putative pyruvate formate lyase activating enzyme